MLGVGDAIALVQATRDIIAIVDAAFAFSGECKELKTKCQIVEKLLTSNASLAADETSKPLQNTLQKALSYLKECKRKRIMRNPLFEVLFHPRIETYTRKLDEWIVIAILSADVRIEMTLQRAASEIQEVHDVSKVGLSIGKRVEEKLDFVITAERLGRLGTEEHKYLNPKIRSALWDRVTVITLNEVEALNEPNAHAEFTGSLKTGEAIRFVPLEKGKSDTPRLLVVYGELSRSVGIQRLFGRFEGRYGDYAVLEDVNVYSVLNTVLSTCDPKAKESSRLSQLKLCLDLTICIAYLHSVNIVVKVISDSSVYLRNVNGNVIPVLGNLQHARLV